MPLLNRMLIACVLVVTTGCASRAPFIQDQTLSQSNSGLVTIYRTRTLYHSLNPEKPFVYIDDKELGELGVGETVFVKLAPGEYKVAIREPLVFQPSYESRSLKLQVKAGERYFLRYSKEMSGVVPLANGPVVTSHTGFDVVPASMGEERK